MFHAGNTEAEVELLANSICEWAKEMIDIEKGEGKSKIPKAAQQIYAMMADV